MTFPADILAKLTTFCSGHIRHMGYLNEAIAMRRRARERREAWQPHLDNTRRFVSSAAHSCGKRDRVVVLGSGLLLDLPLPELSSLFQEVVLMDVVCLPNARREINKYGNASFIEADVTGIAERLYLNRHCGVRELPEPEIPSFLPGPVDLVISLNILSQLWVIPRMFALNEFPDIGRDCIEEWCSEIVASHWRLLEGMKCPVCVVGDYEFVKRDWAGEVCGRGSTIGGLSLPPADETWVWSIEPEAVKSAEYFSRELLVGAWKRGMKKK